MNNEELDAQRGSEALMELRNGGRLTVHRMNSSTE